MARPPLGEHLIAPAGIGADAERSADMVEHDDGVGKFPGEVGELADLRVVEPSVEQQAVARKPREAGAEFAVEQDSFRNIP